MNRFVVSVAVLGLIAGGCPAPQQMSSDDDVLPEDVYDGPTSSGVIPVYEPETFDGGDPLIDAGEVVVDTTCCTTQFSISDQEPADAVGLLQGESSVFGDGLALDRTDAGWSATACFPINASAFYWYAFSWDGGFVDGGVLIEDRDGGAGEIVAVQLIETSTRASDREPSIDTATGLRNFYREVSSCDGLDGSVP